MTPRTTHRQPTFDLKRVGAERRAGYPVLDRHFRFVEPDPVPEFQPFLSIGSKRGVQQRTVDVDRNHRPVRVSTPELLDFRPHPPRCFQCAAIGNNNQHLRTVERRAQGAVELVAGRCLVLAEEDGEVVLPEPPCQIGGITVCSRGGGPSAKEMKMS